MSDKKNPTSSNYVKPTTSSASSEPILGEEPDVGRSLAATLRIAAMKGYLDKKTEKKEKDDDINLQYIDDAGHRLDNPKEAFRHLSHKFHGKGPSKNKIDKRYRKKEIKNKQAPTPLATAELMLEKTKELQSPCIVLSKGK